MIEEYKTEIVLSVLAFMWLLFTATNINQQLGTIYTGFIIGSISLLIATQVFFNKKFDVPLANKRISWINAMVGGVAGWISLIFIQSIVYKSESLIKLWGVTALALSESKFANFITFGIVIAYTETVLWARLYEFFSDYFNTRINKQSLLRLGNIMLIVLLSFVFMVFHITAKGISNTVVLLIVFSMMVISLIMVSIYEEMRPAIILHILANSIASYYLFFG